MRILLQMCHVTLVDSSGGAEKVLCNMANAFSRRGHSIAVVCNDPVLGRPFFPLDDTVAFHNLHCPRTKHPFHRKLRRALLKPLGDRFSHPCFYDPILKMKNCEIARKYLPLIEEFAPDVIVAFFYDDLKTLVDIDVCGQVPVILMHHGDHKFLSRSTLKKRHVRDALEKCHCLQFLIAEFRDQFTGLFPHKTTVVIPNAVPQIEEHKTVDWNREEEHYRILMLARLEADKQQHTLIDAFAKIADAYPQWQVDFYGAAYSDGYRQRLERMITDLHLGNRVFLRGTTAEPLEVFKHGDIFALPSRSEGFPLALTEAMAMGLPCVGLKSASGVNELIVDGENGFLSQDSPDDFAQCLKELMENKELRMKYGYRAREMMKRYVPEKIWDAWENLFLETIGTKPLKSGLFCDKIAS